MFTLLSLLSVCLSLPFVFCFLSRSRPIWASIMSIYTSESDVDVTPQMQTFVLSIDDIMRVKNGVGVLLRTLNKTSSFHFCPEPSSVRVIIKTVSLIKSSKLVSSSIIVKQN